jgi:thiol-disulfide isomerase/thioredoxin
LIFPLMKTFTASFVVLLALLAAPRAAAQSRYTVGQTVANFTLTDRATGRPVQLTDFAGKIVFLEWFAWWCPFCQAAAAQIEPGIVRAYAAKGGNPAGIPVLHVSLNLQPGQEPQTQQFVDSYKLGQVLNDFDRGLANRFQSGGQPIFAIINGVAGSTSHKQWELVFSQLGYGSTQAPLAAMQAAIDSVRAPTAVAVTPPAIPVTPVPPVAQIPVAPAILTQPGPVVVVVGAPATLSVSATVAGSVSYQWFRDGVALAGATGASYTVPSVALSDAGNYTVRVSTIDSAVTSQAARLTVNTPPVGLESRLSNLSVLTTLAAEQLLTVGFTMQGGAKPVLLRAAGPGLKALGVAGAQADPRLALFNGSTQIATNDNWSGNAEVTTASANVGAFAFAGPSSLDAALVSSVEGSRTMQVSGSSAGTVIVEAYDAGTGFTARLINLSALNQAGRGTPLTAGFTIAGAGTKNVLIRAIGPALTALGVGGALPDPKLELFNSAQVRIGENDNWSSALAATFASVGAFALSEGSRDAALLVTLAAGGYSVQVGPAGEGSGAVLVEVYEVP